MSSFEFYRTDESGTTRRVENKAALAEISAAQMDTHHLDCSVEEVSYSNGNAEIKYSDGRVIHIRRVRKTEGTTIEFKGKKYVTGNVRPWTHQGTTTWSVNYWSGGLTGQPAGPTRFSSANNKPGSVGHAVWTAIQKTI